MIIFFLSIHNISISIYSDFWKTESLLVKIRYYQKGENKFRGRKNSKYRPGKVQKAIFGLSKLETDG